MTDAILLRVWIHLVDLLLVAMLLLIATATGNLVLGKLGLRSRRVLDQLLFAVATGLGIIGTILLGVGALGLLDAWVIGVVIVALAGVGASEIRGIISRTRFIAAAWVVEVKRHPLRLIGYAALASIGFSMVALTLLPPVEWDSLMYQIDVPKEFLKTGRIHLPSDNLHAATAGLVSILYVALISVGTLSAPAVFSAAVAGLLVIAVYAIGYRFFGRLMALWASIGLVGTTTIILVATTARVDVSLAFFLLMAHYALIAASREGSSRMLLLSAVMLGLAVAVKASALVYGMALGPAVLLAYWRIKPRYAWLLTRGPLLFVAIVALVGAPWLLKAWIWVEAPAYPTFSARTLPPWASSLYGTVNAPEWISSDVFGSIKAARQSFTLHDLFLSPGRLTIEREGAFYFTSPLILLAPLGLLAGRKNIARWFSAPAILYLLIVLLLFPKTNLRYLLPAIPPLTIAGIDTLRRLAGRTVKPGRGRALISTVVGILLLPSLTVLGLRVGLLDGIPHLIGRESDAEFLRAHPDFGETMRAVEWINEELAEEGRVLMLFEARGLYFEADVIQDNLATNWALVRPFVVDRDCHRPAGITHVLVNRSSLEYYLTRGVERERFRWDEFEQYANRCLIELWESEEFVVYEIAD